MEWVGEGDKQSPHGPLTKFCLVAYVAPNLPHFLLHSQLQLGPVGLVFVFYSYSCSLLCNKCQKFECPTTQIYYLSVSMNQETRHGLSGPLLRASQDCSQWIRQGWGPIWSYFPNWLLVGRMQFLWGCGVEVPTSLIAVNQGLPSATAVLCHLVLSTIWQFVPSRPTGECPLQLWISLTSICDLYTHFFFFFFTSDSKEHLFTKITILVKMLSDFYEIISSHISETLNKC